MAEHAPTPRLEVPPIKMAPKRADHPQSTQVDRLFEAFVSEVHAAALNVAIMASAANALACRKIPSIEQDTIDAFVPDHADAIRALRDELVFLDHRTDDWIFVDAFLSGIQAGRKAINDYSTDRCWLGSRRAQVLHQDGLVEIWQRVAHLAYLAIRELSVPLHLNLPEPYGENSRVLSRLLTETKHGGAPCVDSYGQIFVPPVPQQRRSPRRALSMPCVIYIGRHSTLAVARDISAGGLGLERVPSLRPGDRVLVQFSEERRFEAVVAWSSSRTAGLRFRLPLSVVDPLLIT